jgi:hypothetical protein
MRNSILVRATQDPRDREHTRRVRHQVYSVEKGFLPPDQLFDSYDDRALVLNALRGGEPVGTLRITDSSDGPLEIFEMHPELASLVRPRARLLEVSRLMVLRPYRSLGVTMPMFRRVFAEVLARRADGLILSCAPGLIRHYRDLLGFRQLSTQPLHHRRLHGLVDYPMILELPDVLAHVTMKRLPAWFAIHPRLCLSAIGLTLVRQLGRLSAPSLALDGRLV